MTLASIIELLRGIQGYPASHIKIKTTYAIAFVHVSLAIIKIENTGINYGKEFRFIIDKQLTRNTFSLKKNAYFLVYIL